MTAPLPFGSVDPFWVDLFIIAAAASLITAKWQELPSYIAYFAWATLAVTTAVICVAIIQVWPGAPIGLPDPIWHELAPQIGRDLPPRVSASAATPWRALGPTLLFALVTIRTLILAADRVRANRLLWLLAWAGLTYAVYGVCAFLLDPGRLLWREKAAYLTSVTGPFVNRNTAAAYWGSIATIWLLLALSSIRDRPLAAWRAHRRTFVAGLGGLCCFGAVAMTGSRAGLLLSATSLAGAAFLWLAGTQARRSLRLVTASAICGAALLLVNLWGGFVAARIDAGGLSDSFRSETYRATFRIIADHPWLGTGLGTFEFVFPSYRPDSMGSSGIWEVAHSTPLELAAELGIPLALTIASLWIWGAILLLRGSLRRRRDRYAPIASLCIGCLGTLQSCIDFPLQVPGYATTFAAIMACGLAQSFGNAGKKRRAAP